MSKPSNGYRKNYQAIPQEKPIRQIAAFSQVPRQRVYQLVARFLNSEIVPENRKDGRKPKEIDDWYREPRDTAP